jgi:molybdopterin-synthase adenylyltransferase
MDLSRYQRQTIFPPIGVEGQERLLDATAVIVGCGATGSALANLLARAGVGRVRIIDRDFIELNNLQRQILFDEDDIAANLPKAEAAARKLRRINSQIDIEAVVADVNAGNVLDLIADATVLLDGTDNFTARFLLNDACLQLAIPWIYTGVLASYGMTATFVPDGAPAKLPGDRAVTGCLRCLLGDMPAPGSAPTCDTAGIIGPVVTLLTSIAAAEALKLIIGRGDLNRGLVHFDLWTHEYEQFGSAEKRADCPACGLRRFDYLNAELGTTSASLCGRNAVQVSIAGAPHLDLVRLEQQLQPVTARIARNEFLLRARIDDYEFTVFPDSRAIIKGTENEDLAKVLYARFIGG